MKKLATVAAAIAVAGSAFAAGTMASNGTSNASTSLASQMQGVYVGANLGFASPNTPHGILGFDGLPVSFLNASTTIGGFAYGANVGYQVMPVANSSFLVGGELGVTKLGQSKYNTNIDGVTASLKYNPLAIDVLAVGRYVANSGFNAFVKAGFAWLRQSVDFTTNASGAVAPKDRSAIKPEVDFGLGYAFTPKFNLTGGYKYIFGANNKNYKANIVDMKVSSVTAIYVGLSYNFGS